MRPKPLMPTFNVMWELVSSGLLPRSPVVARAGPAECHVTDRSRAGVEERGRTSVERGAGRQHIVHHHEVQAAHAFARDTRTIWHRKCAVNVRGTLPGSQPRLRAR